MSRLNEVMPIVEQMLDDGIEDRDLIVAAVRDQVDVDIDELLRVYFTKAVSFSLANIRDDMGRRLVYQLRENGKNIAIHLGRTTNYELVRKLGNQKKETARAINAEGDRLLNIADQIEMNFGAAA